MAAVVCSHFTYSESHLLKHIISKKTSMWAKWFWFRGFPSRNCFFQNLFQLLLVFFMFLIFSVFKSFVSFHIFPQLLKRSSVLQFGRVRCRCLRNWILWQVHCKLQVFRIRGCSGLARKNFLVGFADCNHRTRSDLGPSFLNYEGMLFIYFCSQFNTISYSSVQQNVQYETDYPNFYWRLPVHRASELLFLSTYFSPLNWSRFVLIGRILIADSRLLFVGQ